uniref:GG11598 n=1 Tax=Drosophila erecta TaxID=7220 RepID=B3P207_DROER
MDKVDDLCLSRILGLLELPDQISMMQSYERCRSLLGSIWRHRLTRISLNLLETPLLGDDFRFILASACQKLLELRISYLSREHFQTLILHCFPNLWLLRVDVLPPFFLCPRQRLQLIQIIPKFLPEDLTVTKGHMLCVDCQSQMPINFDHFQILRAIGKGSFGKSVALLVCELGSALEYLQAHRVVHRDIKPDNILLDDAGHAHLTDFNIATRLQKNALACSMSGTKPYMAPEVFLCALDEVDGHGQTDSVINPDQEFIYFIGSETRPSTSKFFFSSYFLNPNNFSWL